MSIGMHTNQNTFWKAETIKKDTLYIYFLYLSQIKINFCSPKLQVNNDNDPDKLKILYNVSYETLISNSVITISIVTPEIYWLVPDVTEGDMHTYHL